MDDRGQEVVPDDQRVGRQVLQVFRTGELAGSLAGAPDGPRQLARWFEEEESVALRGQDRHPAVLQADDSHDAPDELGGVVGLAGRVLFPAQHDLGLGVDGPEPAGGVFGGVVFHDFDARGVADGDGATLVGASARPGPVTPGHERDREEDGTRPSHEHRLLPALRCLRQPVSNPPAESCIPPPSPPPAHRASPRGTCPDPASRARRTCST